MSREQGAGPLRVGDLCARTAWVPQWDHILLWFAMLMSPAVTWAEVPENALPHLAIVRKGVLLKGRLAER